MKLTSPDIVAHDQFGDAFGDHAPTIFGDLLHINRAAVRVRRLNFFHVRGEVTNDIGTGGPTRHGEFELTSIDRQLKCDFDVLIMALLKIEGMPDNFSLGLKDWEVCTQGEETQYK